MGDMMGVVIVGKFNWLVEVGSCIMCILKREEVCDG